MANRTSSILTNSIPASRLPASPPVQAKPAHPRGLLLTLDVIVVFLFLVSIISPYMLQTRLMAVQHQERSAYDERAGLLMQLSQRLYVTSAAIHQNHNDLDNPVNYTLVGYYDSDWKLRIMQDKSLPSLAALNLSFDLLDAPAAGAPVGRVCVSREMAEFPKNFAASGDVHTLTICDR